MAEDEWPIIQNGGEPVTDKIPVFTFIEQRAKDQMKLMNGRVWIKRSGTPKERIDSAILLVLKAKTAKLSEVMIKSKYL
jgi:hypothetical protein